MTPSWPAMRLLSVLAAAMFVAARVPPACAEDAAPTVPWSKGVDVQKADPEPTKPSGNMTVIERAAEGGGKAAASVKLVALLTVDGQEIDQGLIWRVYSVAAGNAKPKLVTETREPSPSLKLPAGDYTVNAAFGRANLTRKITVKSNAPATENFVLNAGGLRVAAYVGGKPAPPGLVTYSIFSDEREQFSGRTAVMSNAKPNLVIRLNSGIYRIISKYGDANARIETDVTVEAGKLTETSVMHAGGKATFKLVTRSGGEAMPDTRWIVQTADGEIVKEMVGALPTHILAPGKYIVTASSGGRLYKSNFELKDAEVANVEVLMEKTADQNEGPMVTTVPPTRDPTVPSFSFKNP